MARQARIRIGISGWLYPGWRGRFYPPGLPQRRELEYATRAFPAVEVNGTFYSLKRPRDFETWRTTAPDEFVYALKGGRYITHFRKLKNVETPLANFFASGVLVLEEKLGPILWQLPPQLAFEPKRIAAFLDLLPRDTQAAAALAGRHDRRLAGRSLTRAARKRPMRHAIEVRHESFRDPAFIRLLRRHRVALVVCDGAGLPTIEDVTADFVYVRLHGSEELYASGYTEEALDRWAVRVRAWACGGQPEDAALALAGPLPRRGCRDVYVFFDNDARVRAPFDAIGLMRRLGVSGGREAAEAAMRAKAAA
jgi:uncharacterized protein YecE (DUF72 family)